jgi:hypothetical protein
MHLVTQEIVGKKIDQTIELNTMKEAALVPITTDGCVYLKIHGYLEYSCC